MSLRNIWRVLIVPVFVSLLGLNVPAANAGTGIPSSPSCVVTLLSGDEAVAPRPTCFDPAGADQDELVVPAVPDPGGWGGNIAYSVDGVFVYDTNTPRSTGGLASLVVTTELWSSAAGAYAGPSWRLDFNIDPVGEIPPDAYWVEVGDCFHRGSLRYVKAYVKNEPSSDGRFIRSVWPHTVSLDGATSTIGIKPIARVFEGETAMTSLYTFEDTEPGLVAGVKYVVTFYRSDTGDARAEPRYVAHQTIVDVPECGTSGGTVAVKPRATISVLKCRQRACRVKVVLGSHQATKATRYTVIKDPRRGPTVRKTFNVKYKVLYLRNVRKRTLVKVAWPPRKVVSRRVR